MANEDVQILIDFRFVGGAKKVPNLTDRIVTATMQSVGFKAARNRQRRLQSNIQRDFIPIVERELQEMARKISTMAVGLANPNNPPPGSLEITGRISRAMLGQSGPMSIASVTGQWAVRSKAYMKWKTKRYHTRRWFYNTGKLQRALANVGTYRAAYGPISVRFIPTKLSGPASVVSNLGRSSGGQSTNITIGRVEVTPLRRIRITDLPGIGQKADYRAGLLSPLANSVEKKLKGHPSTGYRPVIEPFLTYYLGRKIPNAVFRRLEDSLT